MTNVHFSRRGNGWNKVLSGCLVPRVGSPTGNDIFLLMAKPYHHFVLMAQSIAYWSHDFHGWCLQGTLDPKTRRALLPHSKPLHKIFGCLHVNSYTQKLHVFSTNTITDLLTLKSKLLALQHAAAYTAYLGSFPKKIITKCIKRCKK